MDTSGFWAQRISPRAACPRHWALHPRAWPAPPRTNRASFSAETFAACESETRVAPSKPFRREIPRLLIAVEAAAPIRLRPSKESCRARPPRDATAVLSRRATPRQLDAQRRDIPPPAPPRRRWLLFRSEFFGRHSAMPQT